jgi:hypothetical protein
MRNTNGQAAFPCRHVSPAFPFPGNHRVASSSPLGEFAAVRDQAVAGVPSVAADEAAVAAVDEQGQDPCI